jgi:DNA topoisomerase-3
VKGVIGIGRVKTPTLAIVCRRELEIVQFTPEDYFEVVATATVLGGSFQLRHAPPPAERIKARLQAEAIAAAAEGFRGPLSVKVEAKRQAPPRLFDLPALQKACGQRWGWTAEKTLAVAQELYDGQGKKLITYPRAEARYLAENQIGDVPAILGALLRLRGFAVLEIGTPVIRRGRGGHFHDPGLAGVSHHAVVPNVNVMADLEARLARLGDEEKRLFALICRSYLAAVMPDYRYQQTTVLLDVSGHAFRAVGRIPLEPGWKAVYGPGGPEGRGRAGEEDEAAPPLPPLSDGEIALLSKARVEEKRTQAPPRYNEGTLIDAMQNAWRFVEEPLPRERLKEAKGIGTPATRAAVLEGLKRQGLLTLDGKWIVPMPAGLELHALLGGVAPVLVDPGTTALWELKLDGILQHASDVLDVVEEIAAEADRLIAVLQQQRGRALALAPGQVKAGRGPADHGRGGNRRSSRGTPGRHSKVRSDGGGVSGEAMPRRGTGPLTSRPPTAKMLSLARQLAREQKLALPAGVETDYGVCRRFLDAHAALRRPSGNRPG